MNKEKLNIADIRNKILKGLDLTITKLIEKKKKEDGELVYSKNGKVILVKASDLAA